MRVAVHTPDKMRFPNLALMKISAWHKNQGDSVEWFQPLMSEEYDKIYSSKVFTFTPCDPYLKNDERVEFGGTGYNIPFSTYSFLSQEIEHIMPDYSLYGIKDCAYGFTTRGCPNSCQWCIVPSKEGKISEHAEVKEFWNGQKKLVLMDNNILAHEHGIKQLEIISNLPTKLDCNQGIDARRVDNAIANLFARIKWQKIRFACDQKSQMPAVEKAVKLIRSASGKKGCFFVYVLCKDIEDALFRVMFLRGLGVDPFVQPYRDFENNVEPTIEQKHFARWVNRKWLFKSCTWEEYCKKMKVYSF